MERRGWDRRIGMDSHMNRKQHGHATCTAERTEGWCQACLPTRSACSLTFFVTTQPLHTIKGSRAGMWRACTGLSAALT